jgi:hypothetical protein
MTIDTTKELPSIKAQLKGVTDRELSKETLVKDYFNTDSLTVYTVLRSVSASGMTRHISLKVAHGSNIFDITYLAAQALGDKVHDKHGHNTLKVNGCGMDMGFHIVYSLSSVLYAGQDRAGYVLSHRWI